MTVLVDQPHDALSGSGLATSSTQEKPGLLPDPWSFGALAVKMYAYSEV